jgi:hypothetical protein
VAFYYFLTAQLPYLTYGQTAPITLSRFRELCRENLTAEDLALLESCALDPDPLKADLPPEGRGLTYGELPPETPSVFLNRWRQWERALRLHLAKLRSQQLKRDAGVADPPDMFQDAQAAAKAAFAMESPLEAELYLDKARWDAIEDLQGMAYFHRDNIFAYLHKLLLLERRASFKTEEGFMEYQSLYASIMESSDSGVLLGEAALPGEAAPHTGEPK